MCERSLYCIAVQSGMERYGQDLPSAFFVVSCEL